MQTTLKKYYKVIGSYLAVTVLLSACAVGPNYVKPSVPVPEKYKEAPPEGWKFAQPRDEENRGFWWEIFKDPVLNQLETQVEISNQNIAIAEAQYRQSIALVAEARAAFFPTVNGMTAISRQKPTASRLTAGSTTASSSGIPGSTSPFNTYLLEFDGSWTPDIWGGIRRSVEASRDTAEASKAQLAAACLSMQSSLAQNYFQLRTLDVDQKLLDDTVANDQKLLILTQNRYKTGTASLSDTATAEAQLKAAQAAAIDNGVNRAQFEHAIAVLIGKPPSLFAIKPKVFRMQPPLIPTQVPSTLLERRPDVAVAERQVASANAQIGVAIAAYFPTLTIPPSGGYQSNKLSRLFTEKNSFWSIGAQLVGPIINGGLISAQVKAARANYDQTVANYRQVVLSAFQNVEDNYSTQRILKSEAYIQKQAIETAKLALKLQIDNYKAGTTDYTSVITAQTNAFNAEKNGSDLIGRQMIVAVGLITALGGGWGE